jgi:AI-2E family transporter
MIWCTSLHAAPTRRVLPLNDPRGVPCGCRDQSLFGGDQRVERPPRLRHVSDTGRRFTDTLARVSRGEDHRKTRPAHLHLAREINAVHDAAKPDVREDHGDLTPAAASGAAEFHARTHRYTATVFAAGGGFRTNGTVTKCGRLGARPNPSDDAIHRDPELCQRLLHDGAVSFFLLVSGDIFLHRLVEILPRFSSKRQVVEISQQIESDISAYLVTITIMNAAVGLAMALAMWLTRVGDPILWGTVAFLLNYVPILGTALGVLIFFSPAC